jgi:hypothetical protein
MIWAPAFASACDSGDLALEDPEPLNHPVLMGWAQA